MAPLRIDAVHFQGGNTEYVVVINVGDAPVDLAGWRIGDAQVPGAREGIYALPGDRRLAPGERLVIARNGAAFHIRWGRPPDAQLEEGPSGVPVLPRVTGLATGTWALNDAGDEVVLLDPAGQLADAVAYGQGDVAALGLTATLVPQSGLALQRLDGFTYPQSRDPRLHFMWAPPDPFAPPALPTPQAPLQVSLDEGWVALWGTLGAVSTLDGQGLVPPHGVIQAAAAQGLGFVGLQGSDPRGAPTSGLPIRLPTWWWSDGTASALVLGSPFSADSLAQLLDGLAARGDLAFWRQGTPPVHPQIRGVIPESIDLPSVLDALEAPGEQPPSPIGVGQPAFPWYVPPRPGWTGVAAQVVDEPGVRNALQAGRTWLTTRPGLALTLRAETDQGTVWMGSTAQPSQEMRLVVTYQDLDGEAGGLSLWRDGELVARYEAPATARWTLTVPGIPGSRWVAAVTQADGDLAVTAPLQLAERPPGPVRINEVLPVPGSDHNRDGRVDAGDEYIELYNPDPIPVSLRGWRLRDAAGREYAFPAAAFVLGQGYRLLWGKETRLALNDRDEQVELLDPTGQVVDAVSWQGAPGRDQALGRLDDPTAWHPMPPSPGEPNRAGSSPGGSGAPGGSPGNGSPAGPPSVPTPVLPTPTPTPPWGSGPAPGTPGGEAVGPAGSVAAAKLRPEGEWVEVRARVVVPPGLFNSAIYVADPVPEGPDGLAWIGIQVYLRRGTFPPLTEGDQVLLRGRIHSFRGEEELLVERPEDVWRIGPATPLAPLPVTPAEIGESLEGRLVTLEGVVTGWQGRSFFLADPTRPDQAPVEVHVRSSLPWRRPYVERGERWRVTGVVSQFARRAPWEGGYRVLVRYPTDLIRLAPAPGGD